MVSTNTIFDEMWCTDRADLVSLSLLAHCILVDSSIVIYWTSPFVILGVLGLFCRFSISDEKSGWQTVLTLIRCHIMWHLIWVCTVCL